MFDVCQILSNANLQCSAPCLEERPDLLKANGYVQLLSALGRIGHGRFDFEEISSQRFTTGPPNLPIAMILADSNHTVGIT